MTDRGVLLPWPVGAERPEKPPPPDQAAREAALDGSRSWIVQAPAGAGKTELLTQRFLTLLAMVEEPEEILAITFTRAATAEMRGRILAALEEASRVKAAAGEPRTLTLARAALAHSQARGWQLPAQPHRLDVQTIDSLCLRLAHGQPLLSRLGGRLAPTEQAAPLYALAAQRTLARLGYAEAELETALEHLLLLRDNNLKDCQQLIAEMLERREQWRQVFVLSEHATVDWEQVRAQLEAPFAEEVRRVLEELHRAFAAKPMLVQELLDLAQYACSNGSTREIALLHGLPTLPSAHADFLEHWGCVRNFLLSGKGEWRKRVNVDDGFRTSGPAKTQTYERHQKSRMEDLLKRLAALSSGERLRGLLAGLQALPALHYDKTQWQTLLSVFRVLRHAVAELHVVFAERNQVDFPELSIAAAAVLDDRENTRGLLASEARRHLLIDEFQDTSRHQHQLIGRLLAEWQPGDGRTCFLVGDPMQSIYIFRQAEVELFGRVQRRGVDCGSRTHPCADLRLSENFRSHAGLVDPLNRYFAAIFSTGASEGPGEVPFAPSSAATPAPAGPDAVQVHPFFVEAREAKEGAGLDPQVARVVELVKQQLPRVHAAQAEAMPFDGRSVGIRTYNIAILGRVKNHLVPIAAALRESGIPFRAIELETLAERQEILDLLSILRALLHPMDRIAWLSVLRAPWCGLALGDLHRLTGSDDREYRSRPIPELMEQRAPLLSEDGRARLGRVAQIMTRAAAERGPSLAVWVERTWTSLGAPAYLRPEERENAETFFRLLDGLSPDGIDVLNGSLNRALELLCAAPDASVSESFGVQLMTIHKAKGLGFEVVIVPALERKAGSDSLPLVTVLARARPVADGDDTEVDEVLVAPLGARGEQHRTYKWIEAKRRRREAAERKRLFYVACTRARQQLHLLGTAEVNAETGAMKPGAPDSLLATAWPALEAIFETHRQQRPPFAAPVDRVVRPLGPVSVPNVETDGAAIAAQPGLLEELAAAGGETNTGSLSLLRVPADFTSELALENVTAAGTFPRTGSGAQPSFERPEGSFEQRARGNAVHAMLDLVSRSWDRNGRPGDAAALAPQLERCARAALRRAGVAPARVEMLAPSLTAVVVAAASSEEGRWLLAPHPDARSEWSFSGWTVADARLRTMRVDRTFRAGEAPLASGIGHLWIIDYKTGAEPGGLVLEAWLEAQKEQWGPQLETYGATLRAMRGEGLPVRYGLYFPELLRLKSWPG